MVPKGDHEPAGLAGTKNNEKKKKNFYILHVGDRAQECVEIQVYERRRQSERGTGGGTVRPVSGLVTRMLRPFVATERSYVADCYVCCVFFCVLEISGTGGYAWSYSGP